MEWNCNYTLPALLNINQRGSLVVEHLLCPGFSFPAESNQRFQIGSWISLSNDIYRVVQRKHWLTCCQINVTGRGITRLCLRCDISVRHYWNQTLLQAGTILKCVERDVKPNTKKCSFPLIIILWRKTYCC